MIEAADVVRLAQVVPDAPQWLTQTGLGVVAAAFGYLYFKSLKFKDDYFERVVVGLHQAGTAVIETGKTNGELLTVNREMLAVMRERDRKYDLIIDKLEEIESRIAERARNA